MEDLPERYSLETVEQLRAVADPLRIRIFEALTQQPLTATQVGEELQIAAPKAHYHVRELERLGLVTLAETRERGGIIEKYYRAIARNLTVPPQLLQTAEPEEVAAAVNEIFMNLSQRFLAALRHGLPTDEAPLTTLGPGMENATVWMTPDELKETLKSITSMLEPYRMPRRAPGEREGQISIISLDAQLTQDAATTTTPPTPERAAPSEPPPTAPSGPRRRRMSSIGALNYNRADLERVIAAGEALDLDVVGYLAFSDDVTPELIDRAIAKLRYRGVLSASSEVLQALKRKEPNNR